MIRRPPRSTLFPYTTLFRSEWRKPLDQLLADAPVVAGDLAWLRQENERLQGAIDAVGPVNALAVRSEETRLNSSHLVISYAVFCLKKKKHNKDTIITTLVQT